MCHQEDCKIVNMTIISVHLVVFHKKRKSFTWHMMGCSNTDRESWGADANKLMSLRVDTPHQN